MTAEESFIEALRQHIAPQDTHPAGGLLPGQVESVSESTCTVKLAANDLVLEDVRFRATEEATDGWAVIPKKGTNCLVALVGGDVNRPYLVAMDEAEAIQLRMENEELRIDEEGFDLMMKAGKLNARNDGASLKDILQKTIEMIEGLTLSTSTGPSGTPMPPTITKANQVKNSIQSLFK